MAPWSGFYAAALTQFWLEHGPVWDTKRSLSAVQLSAGGRSRPNKPSIGKYGVGLAKLHILHEIGLVNPCQSFPMFNVFLASSWCFRCFS